MVLFNNTKVKTLFHSFGGVFPCFPSLVVGLLHSVCPCFPPYPDPQHFQPLLLKVMMKDAAFFIYFGDTFPRLAVRVPLYYTASPSDHLSRVSPVVWCLLIDSNSQILTQACVSCSMGTKITWTQMEQKARVYLDGTNIIISLYIKEETLCIWVTINSSKPTSTSITIAMKMEVDWLEWSIFSSLLI